MILLHLIKMEIENDYEIALIQERRRGFAATFNKRKAYGQRKVRSIQSIYIVSAVLWLCLILVLRLYRTDLPGYFILSIPLFVFAFGFVNSNGLSADVEEDMFKANYLSIGLLVVLPLLTWFNNDYKGSGEKRRQFMTLIIVALILTMLSLVDVWVPKKWVTLVKHVKSVLQTASLALIIFALYTYYIERISQECPPAS